MKKFFQNICLLLSLISFTNICQSQYLFNNISKENGLGTSSINCIEKDNEGFIWMGTNKGLFRFDGTDVIAFQHNPNDSSSISEDVIISLFLDKEGEIWAGTRDKGVNIINTETLNIYHIYPNNNNSSGLISGQNSIIYEDEHSNIFITCSFWGFDIYNKNEKTFLSFKPTDQINNLQPRLANTFTCSTPDPINKNIIWIGTLQGIFQFDLNQKVFSHFPINMANAENPELFGGREEIIRNLLFVSDSELYFASWGGGIGRLNTITGTFQIYKYETLQPVNGARNNVKKLVRKNEHELWFAAEHQGLGILDMNIGQTSFLKSIQSNNNAVNHPSDIIYDEDGYLFVSSYSGGLFFTQTHAHQFNKFNIPFHLISGDDRGKNIFWAGSYGKHGKLIRINLESSEYKAIDYNPIDDVDDNFFTKIINQDSLIWLIESFNLYSIRPDQSQIKIYSDFKPSEIAKVKDPHHFLRVGATDNDGDIWIGSTFNGIFKIDPLQNKVTNYYEIDGLTNNLKLDEFIFSMYTDSKGRIWYGSNYFGYFNPENESFVHYKYPEVLKNADIKLNKIFAITEDSKNNIYLGTENAGIGVISIQNESASFIKSFTIKNGLPSNQIHEMITDKNDNVWVITSEGLSRINTSDGNIENYNEQYGLQKLYFMSLLDDGRIFIGSNNGYYLFHPDKIKPLQKNARLYIKSFKIFDEVIKLNPSSFKDEPVRLNYNQNFFSIEFGQVNFFKDHENSFSYILEGLDEKWQQAGDRTYLSYTNLKGGNYTLRITTGSAEELVLPLFIETPYWKTWWFYTSLALAVLAFGINFHFFRLNQIKKQEKIKAEYTKKISELEIKALRAQMNPHFLFNSLNSIRYYILKEDNESAAEYITKFSKLLRLILNNSRQNQISLKDEIYALEIYIDFERMRFNNKFDYKIDIEKGFDPGQVQIQPLMIQPFVENAIWHGLMHMKDTGCLKINVSKNEELIQIIIEDNGIGRQKAKEIIENGLEETKSFGLKITEDRMNLMESIKGKKSNFKVIDLFDNKKPSGTKVIITFEI